MKRSVVLAVLVLVFVHSAVCAQTITWYKMTTGTMLWDAVPKVATTDQANQYQVMWRTDLVSTGSVVGIPIVATQLAINIPADVAAYYFGVKALRMQGGVKVSESAVSWSSDPAVTNNAPWAFNTILSPSWPGGLRFLPQ